MKRIDLHTKEEFQPKRINQKFANSQNRIKYYNKKANEFRHSIDYINKPLQNNIKILNDLMTKKIESIFHKQFLLGKGFNIEFYSHITTYEKKMFFAIHNYIVIPISDDKIKIIKYK
jgi:hypothetical protein